jgi:hypothetical protein
MKKLSRFLLVFIFWISGCTFNVDVLTPAPPAAPIATPTIDSPVATISPTAEFSFTPTPTVVAPMITGALFVTDAPVNQDGKIFPAGIKQIFVLYNYSNMSPGMTVRREWYLNGQLWLTREEPWNFTKYGANGATQDVSIYDFDAGLPTGIYELRIYIDNVIQPIGTSDNGQPATKARFEIRSNSEAQAGSASPDFQWAVEVFGERRIVLEEKSGTPTTIYTAREVPYLSWFNDSKHFLFVDRDRSAQKPGTSIGVRDDLWLVDVPSGAMHLLYKSDTSFNGHAGPVASPDGKYIASLEGSAYADACTIDSRLIFFELAADFNSVKPIKQEEFTGLPVFIGGTLYPVEDGTWQNGDTYRVRLDGTCNSDTTKLGFYTFNPANRVAAQAPVSQIIPGDLGVGMIHGTVTDAVTGAPIPDATVICEQHSYTSSPLCSGTLGTPTSGIYAFNNVYFHDTDTITIRVQAPGYETKEVSQNFFTTNDWQANIALNKTP